MMIISKENEQLDNSKKEKEIRNVFLCVSVKVLENMKKLRKHVPTGNFSTAFFALPKFNLCFYNLGEKVEVSYFLIT